MLLEPPFPGGCWRPPDDGRAGPVINTQHTHYTIIKITTTPYHHWGPVMGPLEGRECQVPGRGSALSLFPCLFLSYGIGRKRVGPGMPQGDGPAPMILAPTQGWLGSPARKRSCPPGAPAVPVKL